MSNQYINNLKKSEKVTSDYYIKSLEKTQQQLFLEELLSAEDLNGKNIADIACGAGTLSYHLSNLYKESRFSLIEKNEMAIELAKSINNGNNFDFISDDIYTLEKLKSAQFDYTFCWQTLSWLEDPQTALNQLIRITKKGGKIYLSSLFNLDKDVDIYSKVIDYTRGDESLSFEYNTYSKYSILKWIEDKVDTIEFIPFHPNIDIKFEGRGLGTYTIQAVTNKLQISGGMLMNWAVLILKV